jgi:hypothetical protein
MVKRFMFSFADLKNNLHTYLRSPSEKNCLKSIEVILGFASYNAFVYDNFFLF